MTSLCTVIGLEVQLLKAGKPRNYRLPEKLFRSAALEQETPARNKAQC